MLERVLNTLLDDSSRFDRLSKFVLLRKPSVSTVLPIISNQSKTKTNPHIVFKTFIKTIFDKKLKRFHSGFFELEMLQMFARAFLLKIIIET